MSKKVSNPSQFFVHLLQSHEWQQYEELEGHKTLRLTGKNYTLGGVFHETFFANYLFLPYGPSAANKTALLNALKALLRSPESKNLTFIRLEPTLPLNITDITKIATQLDLKAKKSHNLDPAHTWQLDLTVGKDAILKAINPNKTRPWRNHAKKHMQIRTSKDPADVTILTNLLEKVGQVNHFTPQSTTHLKNQLKSGFATLYVVDLLPNSSKSSIPSFADSKATSVAPQGTPIAAALVYDYNNTRYYAHAAADFDHRKLEAGSIILLQSILDAQAAGQTTYDFWGITTSTDPSHPWYGFTKFKKSFGGHQVDYAGTYDLILKPKKYALYSLFRKLNRTLRKIRHK